MSNEIIIREEIRKILAREYKKSPGMRIAVPPIIHELENKLSTQYETIAEIFNNLADYPDRWIMLPIPGQEAVNFVKLTPKGLKAIEELIAKPD